LATNCCHACEALSDIMRKICLIISVDVDTGNQKGYCTRKYDSNLRWSGFHSMKRDNKYMNWRKRCWKWMSNIDTLMEIWVIISIWRGGRNNVKNSTFIPCVVPGFSCVWGVLRQDAKPPAPRGEASELASPSAIVIFDNWLIINLITDNIRQKAKLAQTAPL
jgi:hypothetical protein